MPTTELIQSIGYVGLFAIVFAETGLLIGFFLPGDTLLISAGILAARGQLHIALVIAVMATAAVLGDATGYMIGRQAGRRLFQREDSFWFRREHLARARGFYERHGGKTIFLARFLTGVRTFAPVVAGAAEMPYRYFALFNVAGAAAWICSITLMAYSFGSFVKALDHWIFIGSALLLPFPIMIALAQWFRLQRTKKRFDARRALERAQHALLDQRAEEADERWPLAGAVEE